LKTAASSLPLLVHRLLAANCHVLRTLNSPMKRSTKKGIKALNNSEL
jgi:hypothetical protein